jgi:hypothetical protein
MLPVASLRIATLAFVLSATVACGTERSPEAEPASDDALAPFDSWISFPSDVQDVQAFSSGDPPEHLLRIVMKANPDQSLEIIDDGLVDSGFRADADFPFQSNANPPRGLSRAYVRNKSLLIVLVSAHPLDSFVHLELIPQD